MEQRVTVKVIEKFDANKLILDHIAATGTDESFFIVDVGDVVKKFLLWYELLPRIDPDYAFKCNTHPSVAGTLAALGAGNDCASSGEIEKVLVLGVKPEKIVFAQTVKPVSHLKFAEARNVKLMTFDNEEELYKIKKNFPTAELLLRLRFDPETTNKIGFGEKFGCMPGEKSEFLLRKAKELGLNLRGVAFHIGANCLNYGIFAEAIEVSAAAFDYGKSIGLKMDLLDIGGGFPGCETETITGLSKVINESLEKFFPDPNVRVISEPGTFFADKAFTLAANAHSKNVKIDDEGEEVVHYYITDGIYQSFNMNATHDVPIEVKPLKDCSEKPLKNTIIWGRACDPHDIVKPVFKFPELDCGDWMVFDNSGAYRITTSTLFNGFPNHPIYCFIERDMKEKLLSMKVAHVEIPYDFVE